MPPPNSNPHASLVLVTPQPIRVGDHVTVDASGTTGVNPQHKWGWSIGDGRTATRHTGFPGQTRFDPYLTPQTVRIVLGVTDPKGRIDGALLDVEIHPAIEPPDPPEPPIDTELVPWECRTTWKPGVVGGIPERVIVFHYLLASEFGDGTIEASDAIQHSIDICPEGQVVKLSNGVWRINNFLLLHRSDVTLAGSGPATILRKTNGAKVGQGNYSEDQQPLVIIGSSRWPKLNEDTSMDLLHNGLKGSYTIEVHAATGFEAGQFVLLDEDDYTYATWIPVPPRDGHETGVEIWASDRVVFAKHNPSEDGDDPFPDSLSWFSRPRRPLNEIKEIAAVEGNMITFTTPLHAEYRVSQEAQIVRWHEAHVEGAGLENLTIEGGSDHGVIFNAAAYSWVKNVEDRTWIGEAVSVQQSFRCEIRDSFIHDCTHPYPGGAGYGIGLSGGSSEILIENNIVVGVNKDIVAKSAGAGSVVGYNYMDNAFIGNYLGWIEVGVNGSHMVGPHHILFEGNQSHNYDSDDTHGSSLAMTIFRNHLVGRRRDYPNVDNIRCAGLMHGSWWHSFIGNVLGEPGMPEQTIWLLGYTPKNWKQAADPKVLETCLRDGNFDYLTNIIHWDRPPQELPNSLYLTEKPAFFGDLSWPWVQPDGLIKLGGLPARARFEALQNV